jgi:hypothetical protein
VGCSLLSTGLIWKQANDKVVCLTQAIDPLTRIVKTGD